MPFNLDAPELGSESVRVQLHFLREKHPGVYEAHLAKGGKSIEELYRQASISHTDFLDVARFVMSATDLTPADFIEIGSYIGKDKHSRAAKGASLLQSPYAIFRASETEANPKLNVDSRILVGHLDLDEETQEGQARIIHYNLGLASQRYLLAPLTSVGYYHGVGVVSGTDISSRIRMLDQKAEDVLRTLRVPFLRTGQDLVSLDGGQVLATRVAHNELAGLNYLDIAHPLYRVTREIKLPNLYIPAGEIIQGNPSNFNGQRLPKDALKELDKSDLSFVMLTENLAPYGNGRKFVLREGTILGLDTPAFASVYDFTWVEPTATRVWWRTWLVKALGLFGSSKQSLDFVSEGFREVEQKAHGLEQRLVELDKERRDGSVRITELMKGEATLRKHVRDELHDVAHYFPPLIRNAYSGYLEEVQKVWPKLPQEVRTLVLGQFRKRYDLELSDFSGDLDLDLIASSYKGEEDVETQDFSSGSIDDFSLDDLLDGFGTEEQGLPMTIESEHLYFIFEELVRPFRELGYMDLLDRYAIVTDTRKVAIEGESKVRVLMADLDPKDQEEYVPIIESLTRVLEKPTNESLSEGVALTVNASRDAIAYTVQERFDLFVDNLVHNALRAARSSQSPEVTFEVQEATRSLDGEVLSGLEWRIRNSLSISREAELIELTKKMGARRFRPLESEGGRPGAGLPYIREFVKLEDGEYRVQGDFANQKLTQVIFLPHKN